MRQLPSRLRRLDAALADLPLDEPMLLTELDGFLTGILLCPVELPQAEWMASIWGIDDGGVAPFDDPLDVQWFADAVAARLGEIDRDLACGKPQPIFDVDERVGELVWEGWADGFDHAMSLRPEAWDALAADDAAAGALAVVDGLIAIARGDSALDSMEINAMQDRAPGDLIDAILRLYPLRARAVSSPPAARPAKTGRNDPCRCGSGRKTKRCCG